MRGPFRLLPAGIGVLTVVLDEDRTVESRRLVESLVNTETFRVVAEAHSGTEMAAVIRRGQARIGIESPEMRRRPATSCRRMASARRRPASSRRLREAAC